MTDQKRPSDLADARQARCLRERGEHDWKREAGVPVGTYSCECGATTGAQNGPFVPPAEEAKPGA